MERTVGHSFSATSALIAASILWPSTPAAAASPEFEQARVAYTELRFEEILPLLERALATATQSDEQVAIFELMAFTEVAFGNLEEAKAAFLEVLDRRPEYVLPPGQSPKIRAALGDARYELEQGRAAETFTAQPETDDPSRAAVTGPIAGPAVEPAAYETWWFWTLVAGAVVIAAGATTAGVLAGSTATEPQTVYDYGPFQF